MTTSSVQVHAETTPNPATMKFRFSQRFLDQGYDFPTATEAQASPLASKIFGFPWTSQVYLGEDFITVTKQDWVDWEVLAEPLTGLIREHLEQGLPLYVSYEEDTEEADENDSPLVKRIKQTIKQEIRPVVAMDGGDVVFAKYEDGKLYLHMQGSCAGCPSKSATLKEGIEVRMRELYPEITEVLAL